MPKPSLANRLRAGETVFCGWVATPEPLIAEYTARSGFGAVGLDVQHGLHDPVSVVRSITGIALAGKPSFVRVPVGDFALASRALDMGAEAVIAPMVNTVEDARALADALKYPTLGKRSWGPARVKDILDLSGPDEILAVSNSQTLAIAMVETREALEALDAILGVDGIDGIFVGPSDLSLTLSDGVEVNPNAAWMDEAIRDIAERVRAAGKIPCGFATTNKRAGELRDMGYGMIVIGPDPVYLATGIGVLLEGLD